MTMKLELSLYATGLKNVAGAFHGTSDPFAVVSAIVPGQKPQVLGKTETIQNTLNPQWIRLIKLDYELGTPVKLAISIFDECKGENKTMGSAVFDVGELLGARGNTKARKLKRAGTIFAHVRQSTGSGLLRLKMKGINLKNVEGMFSKSDPFFELSRRIDAAGAVTWDNVYRSKPVKNNLSPTWDDAVIELSTLCGGDLNLPILLTVFDHESSGKHVSMGRFETTVNGLVQASTNGSEDMGKAISVAKNGKDAGHVVILKAEVSGIESLTQHVASMNVSQPATPPKPITAPTPTPRSVASFVDYISGGCELNVVVAIDFTGSNGDPRKPGTLHHLGSGQKNDYEKAISSIVGILSKYDSDQSFPVLGFGAKYNGIVNHCFQCGPTPEVRGVEGVLSAYHQVFQSGLIMSSPTVFTSVIESAAYRAKNSLEKAQQKGRQAYTVLVILTDGAVSDPVGTAECLARASDAPLSIVIIGVGDADFGAMEFLDDIKGARDLVQFVQFNKHRASSVDLSSATLREIPEQLVGYFQSKGIQPLPPIATKEEDIVVEEEEEIDLSLDITEEEIVVVGGAVSPNGW